MGGGGLEEEENSYVPDTLGVVVTMVIFVQNLNCVAIVMLICFQNLNIGNNILFSLQTYRTVTLTFLVTLHKVR